MPAPLSLFERDVPPGFLYREPFITATEEQALLAAITTTVTLGEYEMRGVVSRRRVAFFGHSYEPNRVTAAPFPEFLLPVRAALADWAGIDAAAFAMALINEYPPGAPIGWHRDAPGYGVVGGVSLLSRCRMKFRPYLPPAEARAGKSSSSRRTATHEVLLEPRSAYLMTGESRSAYEHHIPPVTELRYSVTFRTLR